MKAPGPVRVLLAADSAQSMDALIDALGFESSLQVVASTLDGNQVAPLVARLHPDVLVMDIRMPPAGGVAILRAIMASDPVPTVIVSQGEDGDDAGDGFLAREAGAIAVCQRPGDRFQAGYAGLARRIVQMVKMAAEIPVFRRWNRVDQVAVGEAKSPWGYQQIELVAIGASTGGPPVLCEILSGLRPRFPAPVLIVQHIAAGFLAGMVGWLASTSGFPVEIARNGTYALAGRAYMAPFGAHMTIDRSRLIRLEPGHPVHGMCPSVSRLFRSTAGEFGRSAIGILLTGMGRDGADELLTMRKARALTIAQDKESSAVFGMPGEAIAIGAASCVLTPERMVEMLNDRTGGGNAP